MPARAHKKPRCKIIHPLPSPWHASTFQLDSLLRYLLSQAFTSFTANQPQGCTIVDCTSLLPTTSTSTSTSSLSDSTPPSLFAIWILPVSTPSILSLTSVEEDIHKQVGEGREVVVSMFNDMGGEVGEEMGTWMVVLRKVEVEVEEVRCVPCSLSSEEERAVREYVEKLKRGPGSVPRDEGKEGEEE